jgi:hypothetical protein
LDPTRDGHPRVQVLNRWFGFRIEERSSHVAQPTPTQIRRAKRCRPRHPAVKVLEPTGALQVFATEGFETRMWDIRCWSDARRQRVEDRLNEVITGPSSNERSIEANKTRAEARRNERAALRARLEAAHDRRVKRLTTASTSYHVYHDFRAFTALVRAGSGQFENRSPRGRSGSCQNWTCQNEPVRRTILPW